jgi:thiol-disulfide isomerase/thioredoxin
MKTRQLWLVAILVSAITIPIVNAAKLPPGQPMPSFRGANAWLNSPPLSAAGLRGKVVLVDFWTYTCINWRRTLPYLRAWDRKYRDQGLVIVGVHTPEFSFEKDVDNVRRIAKAQGVDYPIAIDSDYAIWNAFYNHYWPALYFVDVQGRIRHHQFGEGDYDKLELVIQQLLTEAGHTTFERALATPDAHGAEVAADWKNLATPETYVGSAQAERFASPVAGLFGKSRPYAFPAKLKLNEWALAGDWTIRKESAVLNKANGKIAYRFHARDVHLVMGPAARGAAVRFRVSIDGQPPGASHGVEVDAEGRGALDEPRMYQLIRQQTAIADRQFEIEFLDPGAQVFVFTFG